MLSSIIGALIILVAIAVGYFIGLYRGAKLGAQETISYMREKYEDTVTISKADFQSLTGYTVEEYKMLYDMYMMDKMDQEVSKPEKKTNPFTVVKDEED
jgi:hypothetical protein